MVLLCFIKIRAAMYEIIQVIIKLFLSGGIAFIGVWIIINPIIGIWKSDIDVRKLFNISYYLGNITEDKPSWLATREEDAIYQNGKKVGRVNKEKILEENHLYFEDIYEASSLDTKKEFEYKKYVLQIESFEAVAGVVNVMEIGSDGPKSRSLSGPVYRKVNTKIVGKRKL